MKNITLKLFVLFFLFIFSSFDESSLVNHPMPLLPNKTLDGKTIDENYYKGHVTIVSCMAIACIPCMMEIGVLNKIKKEYANNEQLQILCVARQMGEQMRQFNGDDTSVFSRVRKAYKVDPITYTIQPACDDGESKMIKSGTYFAQEINLKSECNTLEEKFSVSAVPVIFYVDKKGIVRKVELGGPGTPNDANFHDKVKKEIDQLLAE
jgi:thiol-disulfide isomerase/thioredoxin